MTEKEMVRVKGPLEGVRFVELAGIGPGPFGAMVLADLGAEGVRVDRPPTGPGQLTDVATLDPMRRGRRSIAVDLKTPGGRETVLRLVESADVLIEGYRPGVAERLGVGPEACLARNGRLVYGRMTGWGQDGPLSQAPGHDIDYIAVAGALEGIGRAEQPPTVPLNLVGDFGGGGMLLVVGVLAALQERVRSGRGQVVDAAMLDGAALLTAALHGMRAMDNWRDERASNLLDGGGPFYDVYETADGRYVALGAIEQPFWDELVRRTDLEPEAYAGERFDPAGWPRLRERLTALFLTRTRAEWCAELEGGDACIAPVLSMAEAPSHPHSAARRLFVEVGGVTQPAPAPRFSRTPAAHPSAPREPGQDTVAALGDWGFSAAEIERLQAADAIR